MKKILALILLFMSALSVSTAQVADNRIKINDLQIEDMGNTAKVSFTADIAANAVKRNQFLTFTPVITNEGFRQPLSPIVVEGKGFRIIRKRKEWTAKQVMTLENIVYTENGRSIFIAAIIPFHKWMSGADLIFESAEGQFSCYDVLNDTPFAENIIPRPGSESIETANVKPIWIPTSIADNRIKFENIQIENTGSTAKVSFTAVVAADAVKRNQFLTFTPVITNGEVSQSLSPIVVEGEGSRIARKRKGLEGKQASTLENVIYTENGQSISITASIPLQDLASGSKLTFESAEGQFGSYDMLNDILLAGNITKHSELNPESVEIADMNSARISTSVADNRIKFENIQIENMGNTAKVSFTAVVAADAAKRNQLLTFTPVITNEKVNQSLSPIVVEGEGSRIARKRKEWEGKQTSTLENVIYTENGQSVLVTVSIPLQDLALSSKLALESTEGLLSSYDLADILIAENIITSPKPKAEYIEIADTKPVWIPTSVADSLSTAFSFVVPISEFDEVEPFKIYDNDRESSLVVYFRVAKYNIDESYMNNALVLTNLAAAVNMTMESNDSKVDKIVVAGFASPEGSIELNDRLAFERAVSVKKHLLRTTNAKDDQIMVFNGSVDWRGLRNMVAESDLAEKQQILSIIDNTPIWDAQRKVGRLGELMRLNSGKTYRYLLNNYFPYMRNGAFIKVYYENE